MLITCSSALWALGTFTGLGFGLTALLGIPCQLCQLYIKTLWTYFFSVSFFSDSYVSGELNSTETSIYFLLEGDRTVVLLRKSV